MAMMADQMSENAINDKRDEINTSDLQSAIFDIEANRDVTVKPTPGRRYLPEVHCVVVRGELYMSEVHAHTYEEILRDLPV